MDKPSKCPVCTSPMELVKLDVNSGFAGLLTGGGGYRLEIVRDQGKRIKVMTEARNKSALYCELCGFLALQVKSN